MRKLIVVSVLFLGITGCSISWRGVYGFTGKQVYTRGPYKGTTVTCPHCGSDKIERLRSWWFGGGVCENLWYRFAWWRCNKCEHQFQIKKK